MDRRKFLEVLKKKQRQQEINAIAAFRKHSAPAVMATAGGHRLPKSTAFSSLIPKALRRSGSAQSRRRRRVLPVGPPAIAHDAQQDAQSSSRFDASKATPAAADVVTSESIETESDCHRWVRVGKGRWRQLRQPKNVTITVATAGADRQYSRATLQGPTRLADTSSDTLTVVEPFKLSEKPEKAVQPGQLMYNEVRWQAFISSSPTKRIGTDSTPMELTIEELA